MAGLIKTFIRFGVITGLAGAAVVLVAGPDRSAALFSQAHDHVMSIIDDNIDDPVALRTQLRELESQYPERIAQVRSDLGELDEQVRQLQRDRDIATRVVALTERDLESIEPLLAQAQAQSIEGVSQYATVRFDNRTFSVDQAYTRANQIKQTRIAYANSAADADHDLVYLHTQRERLEELLVQLETERAQFQAQIMQLERQVDAIARNERLITLMEKRKKTIDQCSKFEVASLDQIQMRLAEQRSRQEAELEWLADERQATSYEELAKLELDDETHASNHGSIMPADGMVIEGVHRGPRMK